MSTISEVANKALDAPDTLTVAETIRLGAWVVDHEEHVASHLRATSPRFAALQSRDTSGRWSPGSASLTDRLAPLQPGTAEGLGHDVDGGTKAGVETHVGDAEA